MGTKENSQNILNMALSYHRAGLNVVKVLYKGKYPQKRGKWKIYQQERVSEAKLREWFGPDSSYGNISVVTGAISGGLTVVDFDSVALYDTWKEKYPDLASTLPTSSSGRGYHVYMRSELEKDDTHSIPKIDIKAKGLASIPPSMHKSGKRYKWIIPFPDHVTDLPVLNPYKWGLELFTDGSDGNDGIEGKDGNEGRCESVLKGLQSLSPPVRQQVEQAIDRTLPSGFGQRYALLFTFARMLKKIVEIKNKSAEEIMFIIDAWHEKALPNIEHKSLTLTRARFINAWKDAKYPPGDGETLKIAWERAKKATHPMPELEQFGDDEIMVLLVRLCFELQRLAGPDDCWFVPTNKGKELFNISHSWLATLLRTLDGMDIIDKVKGHTNNKCTRYVYTGPSIERLKEKVA